MDLTRFWWGRAACVTLVSRYATHTLNRYRLRHLIRIAAIYRKGIGGVLEALLIDHDP
jgi:hypothetical protein